jgi:hypothetical protein
VDVNLEREAGALADALDRRLTAVVNGVPRSVSKT